METASSLGSGCCCPADRVLPVFVFILAWPGLFDEMRLLSGSLCSTSLRHCSTGLRSHLSVPPLRMCSSWNRPTSKKRTFLPDFAERICRLFMGFLLLWWWQPGSLLALRDLQASGTPIGLLSAPTCSPGLAAGHHHHLFVTSSWTRSGPGEEHVRSTTEYATSSNTYPRRRLSKGPCAEASPAWGSAWQHGKRRVRTVQKFSSSSIPKPIIKFAERSGKRVCWHYTHES